MLNQTFSDGLNVAETRPPNRIRDFGTELLQTANNILEKGQGTAKAKKDEATLDAAVDSTLEGEQQLAIERLVKAGTFSPEVGQQFSNSTSEERLALLKSASFNEANSTTKLRLKQTILARQAIARSPADAKEIAARHGVGINTTGFSLNEDRTDTEAELNEEFTEAQTQANSVGISLREFGDDKEAAIRAWYTSDAYKLSLQTAGLQAIVANEDASRKAGFNAANSLSTGLLNQSISELQKVGNDLLNNAGGQLDGINPAQSQAQINRKFQQLVVRAQNQLSSQPEVLKAHIASLESIRALEVSSFDGKSTGRDISNDKASIELAILSKYGNDKAKLALDIQEGRRHLTQQEILQSITKSTENQANLLASGRKARNEYKKSLNESFITGDEQEALLKQYDEDFSAFHKLSSEVHVDSTRAAMAYLSDAADEDSTTTISDSVSNLINGVISGDLDEEALVGFAGAYQQFDRIGTASEKRAVRTALLEHSSNPKVAELVQSVPELRTLIPEARLAFQEAILEPLDPIITELGNINTFGRERGELGVLVVAGTYMVVDQDRLDRTGEIQLSLKDKTYAAVSEESLRFINDARLEANRKLSSIDFPTYFESYENYTRNGSNVKSLEDIISGNKGLEGILTDDLQPEMIGEKAFERLSKFFGTEKEFKRGQEAALQSNKELQESLEDDDVELVSQEELNEIALGLATAPREDGE